MRIDRKIASAPGGLFQVLPDFLSCGTTGRPGSSTDAVYHVPLHQLVAQPRKVRVSFQKRSTDIEKGARRVWCFAMTEWIWGHLRQGGYSYAAWAFWGVGRLVWCARRGPGVMRGDITKQQDRLSHCPCARTLARSTAAAVTRGVHRGALASHDTRARTRHSTTRSRYVSYMRPLPGSRSASFPEW